MPARPTPGETQMCRNCGGNTVVRTVTGVTETPEHRLVVHTAWIPCGPCGGVGELPPVGHYREDGCDPAHRYVVAPCEICQLAWTAFEHCCTDLNNNKPCRRDEHHPYHGDAPEAAKWLGVIRDVAVKEQPREATRKRGALARPGAYYA